MKDAKCLFFNLRKCENWVSALHCAFYISMFSWGVGSFLFLKGVALPRIPLICVSMLFLLPFAISYKLSGVMTTSKCNYGCVKSYINGFVALFLTQWLCLYIMHSMKFEFILVPTLLYQFFLMVCVCKLFFNIKLVVSQICNFKEIRRFFVDDRIVDVDGSARVPMWGEKITGVMNILMAYDKHGLGKAVDEFVFEWSITGSIPWHHDHNATQAVLEILCFMRDRDASTL